MSEAVAKAESIESGGNISIEDEMKPEAVKNEGPLLPDNDLKQKRGRRKAAHVKLTNQLRKAVADHKIRAIRLKKLQVAAWRDELIRIYEDVKDLHHKYMESLPDITDPQRQACEKWEVQFDTDHVEILNFAIRYATSSRHSKPMLEFEVKLEQSKSQMEVNATSVTETLSKALKGMGEQLGKFIDSSHVTSTEIAANTQLVKDSHLNAQIEGLRTEIGISKVHLRTIKEQVIDQGARIPSRPQTLSARQDVSARSTLKSLEATVLHRRTLLDADTSSREQLSRPLPIMHPACGPSIGDDTSPDTSSEHQPANGSFNHPHSGCCSHSRTPNFTIQPFDGNPKNYARIKAKFRALYENEYDGSPALLFMLEELLSKEVRNEIGECLADGTMYSVVWDRLDAVYGRTEVMDQTYLHDLLQIQPLKSQDAASLKTFANRLHGAVVTLSQSRYVHELHSRTILMAIEAKLTTYLQEKWNEKRKKAGAELNVLDLDDWVTVKSMSKQHGKNVFESLNTSTSKSVRFDEKKPVKKPNASHTLTIGHVSTEEGSKVTASLPPLGAPMGRRPKTEEKAAEKTDQWRCLACNGRADKLASCNVFMSFTPTKRAEVVFKSGRCLLYLTGKHERRECSRDIKCTIGRCSGSKHHPLLHGSEFIPLRKQTDQPPPSASHRLHSLGH
ncbi:hypothetical protein OUZ56_029608 [Daphnia magna]|uniref:Uncharacterized protein n=1 Tax=Daphnia magna TaxID=35525 RepID=A0ABR0B7R3_9CRUS|nr:hypothetical protein OUZ56_029608 [Daphnia magna]